MKHVKDMTRQELLAAMTPKAQQKFAALSPDGQERFIESIAELQDHLHDEAVMQSWFEQGHFYK